MGPSPEIAAIAADEDGLRESREERAELRVGVAALPSRVLGEGDIGVLAGLVFEPLLPRLAVAELSVDATSVVVELRAGIATHDGKGLSSTDVRYSIELARRRGGAFASELSDLAAIELLGPTRLRLRQRRANGYLLRVLATLPIGRGGGTVGTGPLTIGEVSAESMALEPFAGYAGEAVHGPIELVRIADPSAALAAVQVGDLDLARDRRESGQPAQGVRSVLLEPARFRYLAFNARRTLFADAEVRRAASLMVDRAAIASDGHRGRAKPRQLPIWPGGPISAPAAPVRSANKRAASELLDRAGWARSSDGTRERDERKLIARAVTSTRRDPAALLALDQLRAGGFVLEHRELAPDELAAALASGDFDIAVLEWRGYPDWDLSPVLESRGRYNLGHVESSIVDDSLAALRAARTASDRGERAQRMALAIEEVVPIVILAQPLERLAIGPWVRGDGTLSSRLELVGLERVAPSALPASATDSME